MRPRSEEPLEERMERLFAQMKKWCALWGLSQLARQVEIEFSGHLAAELGRYDPQRRKITLHGLLLRAENEEFLFETLCHELAHAIAFLRYGYGIQPHGVEWAEYMEKAGYHPRPEIPVADLAGRPPIFGPGG